MFFGPEILAAHTALILASSTPYCRITEAPSVNIRVVTDEISYDYSHSTAELSRMKSDTISPYPKGSDTATSGLREDHPQIRSEIKWNIRYTDPAKACMFFKTIDVTLHLKPKIYLAREFNTGQCRDAVLSHERKHIQVDREVMNKYAGLIGVSLQNTINKVGAIGPFNMNNMNAVKNQSSAYVKAALDPYKKALSDELHTRQQAVDNLAEYQRVGSFCRSVKVKR